MSKTLIVAEIGSCWYDPNPVIAEQNALDAINQTSICGADAVKFQLFRASSLYSKRRAPDIYGNVEKYELPLEWLEQLSNRAYGLRLQFGLSVFSHDLIDAVMDLKHLDFIKIASGDLVYDSLLDYAAKKCEEKQKFLQISTGAATIEEVYHALSIVNKYKYVRNTMTLFHCVSAYPSSIDDMNLSVIGILKNRVMSREIGLSDHTKGNKSNVVAQMAVASGYRVFEKHVNLSGAAYAPDNVVASNKNEFSTYVESIRLAENIMGNSNKDIVESEKSERQWARRGKDGLRPVE